MPTLMVGTPTAKGPSELSHAIKKPHAINMRLCNKNWQRLTLPRFTAVPSALRGLTSLFGMGRGGHPRYSHHEIFNIIGYESGMLNYELF